MTIRKGSAGKAERALRIVLITNGLRPVLSRFTSLCGHPIGVVSWHGGSSGKTLDTLSKIGLIARVYACLRGRHYASLAHYCGVNKLRYASIDKSQILSLQNVLTQWQADLVITSGCPLVPIQVLRDVRFGGINLHPSVLPAYRGADPLAWQVLDQVDQVGVCVHRLSEQYDMGPILASSALPRPRGISREELAQQLEGEVGHQLLNQAIQTIANESECEDQEQPSKSPARRARKLTLESVGAGWPLADLPALLVWDIISFYKLCPPQWLKVTGWRRFVKWRPVSLKFMNEHDVHRSSPQWHIQEKGLSLLLVSPDAVISLKLAICK